MYSGPLRLLRALTVSAACVALTLAAHLLGAGSGELGMSVAGVLVLVMITVLLTLVLSALSGRRWTLGRSLVTLALGQVSLNAIFTVLLSSRHHVGPDTLTGGGSMVLAHIVAALMIGLGIAVSESALDSYFCVASSLAGSGIEMMAPWRLATLAPVLSSASGADVLSRGECLARWSRPRLLSDLVVLQCLSRRGPPAFALAS